MQDSDEREIVLSDGRTLAYCEGGDLSSRRVFVFFFMAFSAEAIRPLLFLKTRLKM
jgi:hypothetical protein